MSDRSDLGAGICILFALPEEARPFQKRNRLASQVFCPACSGAGISNAARQAEQVFSTLHIPPRLLIICGFAGALGSLQAGDILVADRVLDYCAKEHPLPEYQADSRLIAAAESVRLPGRRVQAGLLATTDRVLIKAKEKAVFAQATCAAAVDMETAGVLRVALLHNTPWMAVRSITDTAEENLPLDFNQLAGQDGNPDRARILRAILRQPGKIPGLIQLGRRATSAARSLADFLDQFLLLAPD